MSKNRRDSFLWRKSPHSSYYFRCLIPKDLVSILKTKVIVLSLQSGILQESKSLSRNLYCRCQEIFSQLKFGNGLTVNIDEIKSILRQENQRYKSIINNSEMKEWTKDDINQFISSRIVSMKEDSFDFELELRSQKKQKQREKDIERFLKRLEKDFEQGNYKYVEMKLDEDIEKFNLKVTKDSKTYKVLLSNYKNLLIESIRFRRDVRLGKEKSEFDFVGDGFNKNDVSIPKSTVKEQIEEISDGPKLQEVFGIYLEETKLSESTTEKTRETWIKSFKLFVEIIGNIHISQLKHSHGRTFKGKISKLPPNRNKIRMFRDKPINEVIKINKKRNGETLSITTVNHHIQHLSTFFNWMRRNFDVQINPMEGIKIRQSKSKHDERERFTVEDLQKIFDSNNYLTEIKRRKRNSKVIVGCYWIPIILLFTGCRINEISQLHIDDIKKFKGKNLWYFDINDDTDDKRLKNKSSKRMIPVHQVLVDLGFLEYVKKLKKKKEQRVFPELTYTRDGYSKDVSRWFNEVYLTKLDIKIPQRKVIHSFRHTFIDTLKQGGFRMEMIEELSGHSSGGESRSRYGKRYTVDILYKDVMKKLKYPGIDWKELEFSKTKGK
jgi:integrase